MAYGLKYQLIGQNKGGYTITCYIYEDGASSSNTLRCDFQPFVQNILSQTDDIFAPVVASELVVKANITDSGGLIPDFTTNNDRKYWCKLKATAGTDDWELFQGFILTDNVSVPFTTGFIGLQFPITDGLAMLKNIPYEPTDPDINVSETLLNVVLNCLNKIGLPEGYYVNICTSIFATGMNNRGDGEQYEPLSQIYYYPRNWQNSPTLPVKGVQNTDTYISCYDVLQRIALSFGCHVKQSGAEFYFASISEQAGATIYYTRYDETGTIISYGPLDPKRVIEPYSTTEDIFFIDNQQTKILRKGFPDLQLKCPAEYAPQFIYNGTMPTFTAGVPDEWTFDDTHGTLGTCTEATWGPYTGVELYCGTNYVTLVPNSVGKVYGNEEIKLSFIMKALTISTGIPGIAVEIKIDIGGGHQYKWKKDTGEDEGYWAYDFATGFYNVAASSTQLTNVNITTTPAPAAGDLYITFKVQAGSTTPTTFIAWVILTLTGPYSYRLIKNTVTDPTYQKVVELPLGAACDYLDYAQTGSLLKSDGTCWEDWYRYGITETKQELMRCVYQNYYNILSLPSINISGNIWGLFQSGIRPTQPFTAFEVTDRSGILSVTGKSYLIGNGSIDYIDNTISATLLETSDTDITATITDTIILKQ